MEIIVLIFLAGAAAYFLLKHTTKRGTNAVRAYLYLRAINGGASVLEANRMARIDLMTNSHFIPQASERVRNTYDGKQLPMIADAISRGLVL